MNINNLEWLETMYEHRSEIGITYDNDKGVLIHCKDIIDCKECVCTKRRLPCGSYISVDEFDYFKRKNPEYFI